MPRRYTLLQRSTPPLLHCECGATNVVVKSPETGYFTEELASEVRVTVGDEEGWVGE